VPGSEVHVAAPVARYGTDGFLGSGTSQAAAATSGLAAALLSEDPSLTPDEVKKAFRHRADEIDDAPDRREGEGAVDAYASVVYGPPR